MKQAQIAALSNAAITAQETALVVEILIDQSLAETASLLSPLTGEQCRMVRYYLTVWYDKFQDGTTKIKGGKRGLDYDNKRDKLDLTMMLRGFLGLPLVSEEYLEAIAAQVRAQRGQLRAPVSTVAEVETGW